MFLIAMTPGTSHLTTKELLPETWCDFEKLFAKYGGVQAGCWCMYYHRVGPITAIPHEKRIARNQRDKKMLVNQGRSHGVLVFAGHEPVGWCQYGPREELPRVDSGRNYRRLALGNGAEKLWRITCFFVDKNYRRKGVAQAALHAALASIKKRGGGIVEAYPATHKKAVAVWFGTVGMFEREGFEIVATLGRSNLVMRKTI